MKVRVLLLAACVVSAIGLVASGSNLYALRQSADRGELVPQPDHWVAFEATTTRTAVNGQVIRGRVFRGEDGSEHYVESVSDSSSNVTIRHIANYPKGAYYHSAKAGEWTSGPLVVPAGPRKLRQFYTNSAGLRQYSRKLALLAGQDGSLEAMEGLDGWISTTADGSIHILAPSLNFFPVVSVMLNGQRRVLSDIRIGPVPSSYFEPAAGDYVRVIAETFPPGAPPPPN
jgi:hypothetical protein